MKTSHAKFVVIFITAIFVSGCASNNPRSTYTQSHSNRYGVVDSIEVIHPGDTGIGTGTVIGGVVSSARRG